MKRITSGITRCVTAALASAIAVGITAPAQAAAAWSPPTALFGAGEPGVFLDISDLSSMFQDSAGTTPAVVDSPVGKILDKSGRGNHWIEPTTSKKPILRLASGKYYLETDGVDDGIYTAAAVNFSATDKMFVCIGQRVDTLATAVMLELTANASTTAGGLAQYVAANGQHVSEGLTFNDYSYVITTPNLVVMTTTFDRSAAGASEMTVRENTAAKSLTAGTAGDATGNFANAVLNIGARDVASGSGSLFFAGRIYCVIIRGAATSNADRDAAEAFVNSRTGAY